jgi:hypothetical protein
MVGQECITHANLDRLLRILTLSVSADESLYFICAILGVRCDGKGLFLSLERLLSRYNHNF